MSAPGTVLPNIEPYPGVGTLPGATAYRAVVRQPNLPDKSVFIRDVMPDGTPIGSVVLNTGGRGNAFWDDEHPGALSLCQRLLDAGYQLFIPNWQNGWWKQGDKIGVASGRRARLYEWLKNNKASAGTFGVAGNSGGADGYVMTWYDGNAYIDSLTVGSGPPFTSMQLLLPPPTAAWEAEAASLMEGITMEGGTYQLSYEHTTPPNFMEQAINGRLPGVLYEDSVLRANAVVSYSRTVVHSIAGTKDCSTAVPTALKFHAAVQTQKTLQVVSAPHALYEETQGEDAYFRAITGAVAP